MLYQDLLLRNDLQAGVRTLAAAKVVQIITVRKRELKIKKNELSSSLLFFSMFFSASGSQTLLHNFHILISFSGCDGTRFCSVFPILPWLLGREFSIMVGRNMTQTQILYITTIVTLYTHYTTIIVCSSFSYIVTSLF